MCRSLFILLLAGPENKQTQAETGPQCEKGCRPLPYDTYGDKYKA